MRAEIETDYLKQITSAMDNIFLDGFLRFNEDSMQIAELSPDSAIFLEIEVSEDRFNKFEPNIGDTDAELVGVDFENLHSIIKNVNSDSVQIYTEDSKLFIKWEENHFSLPILDLDIEELPPVDGIDLEYECSVYLNDFLDPVQTLSSLIESPIVFSASNMMDSIEAESNSGQSSGSMVIPVRDQQCSIENVRSMFGEDLLTDMLDSISEFFDDDEELSFSIGEEKPMVFEKETEDLYLRAFLSPRIADDFNE